MTVGSWGDADMDGPQDLLKIAQHHCQSILTIIDQLTENKSNTELRLLSQRSRRRERRRCARKPEISALGRWDGWRGRRWRRGLGLFGVLQAEPLRAGWRLAAAAARALRIAKPMKGINAPKRPDCVAGVGGLELRNVVTNYPVESSMDFRESSRIPATETIRV
jgi:hypothetical protein